MFDYENYEDGHTSCLVQKDSSIRAGDTSGRDHAMFQFQMNFGRMFSYTFWLPHPIFKFDISRSPINLTTLTFQYERLVASRNILDVFKVRIYI